MFAKSRKDYKDYRVYLGETDITESVKLVDGGDLPSYEGFVKSVVLPASSFTVILSAAFHDDVQPLIDLFRGKEIIVTVDYSDGTSDTAKIEHVAYEGDVPDIALVIYLDHVPDLLWSFRYTLRGVPIIFREWEGAGHGG